MFLIFRAFNNHLVSKVNFVMPMVQKLGLALSSFEDFNIEKDNDQAAFLTV